MTPLFRYSFAQTSAVRTVKPGETIAIALPDADGLGPDLERLAAPLFEGNCATAGNPVYGPLAIEGAKPGDALRIDFQKIRPNRRIARTLLAPCHGFLPDTLPCDLYPEMPISKRPRHLYLWKLEGNTARLVNQLNQRNQGHSNPVTILTAPFLGCIGTASADQPPLSSSLANKHGGNLDHPDLIEGSTLWLPVAVPDGLLYLGDMHAAQGHGEIAGGGLEISGEVTLRIDLCKGARLRMPRYRTSEGIGCLTTGATFNIAAQHALTGMIQWLSSMGWNFHDASMLISQVCELRPGAFAGQYTVVSCFIAEKKLPGLVDALLKSDLDKARLS